MNIMFEDSITEEIRQRYTLLELDTFYFKDNNITSTAYCLIENTPIQEMITLDQFLDLHKNLLKNYRLKNWKYCEDAIEHLVGKWNGDLDTFYDSIKSRILSYKDSDPGPDWSGLINR